MLRYLVFGLGLVLLATGCRIHPYSERNTLQAQHLTERFQNANRNDVVIVAHRGCWNDAPENSILAIERCIELGVPVVELDVRRTADGVLVLMHDETVDRTTNGSGPISDMSYRDLSRLYLRDAGGGDNASITQQRVPTFQQAMRAAKGRILVNLDAKEDVYSQAFDVLERTETVNHVIMKRSMKYGDAALNTIEPFEKVMAMPVIFQDRDPELFAVREQLQTKPTAIEMIFTDLEYGQQAATLAREHEIPAWVNTLGSWSSAGLYDAPALADPDEVWGQLIEMGYSIIQTDEPEALQRYLSRDTQE